jgi:hypothetical protein
MTNHFRAAVLAHDDDLCSGQEAFNLTRGFQTIHVRHGDVHDHDVWMLVLCFCYGVAAIDGFTTNGEGTLAGDDGTNSLPDDLVVVDNQDPHRLHPRRGAVGWA